MYFIIRKDAVFGMEKLQFFCALPRPISIQLCTVLHAAQEWNPKARASSRLITRSFRTALNLFSLFLFANGTAMSVVRMIMIISLLWKTEKEIQVLSLSWFWTKWKILMWQPDKLPELSMFQTLMSSKHFCSLQVCQLNIMSMSTPIMVYEFPEIWDVRW